MWLFALGQKAELGDLTFDGRKYFHTSFLSVKLSVNLGF